MVAVANLTLAVSSRGLDRARAVPAETLRDMFPKSSL